jgi:hypothetical protein
MCSGKTVLYTILYNTERTQTTFAKQKRFFSPYSIYYVNFFPKLKALVPGEAEGLKYNKNHEFTNQKK